MNKLVATLALGIVGADTTTSPGQRSQCLCEHLGPPWPMGHFYAPSPKVECNKGTECMGACPYGGVCEASYSPPTQAPVHEDRRAQRDKIQKAGAEPTVAVKAVAAPGFVAPAVAVKAKLTPTFPSGSTCTCYHNGPPWPQGHFYNPSPEVECNKGTDCKAACPYTGFCEAPYSPPTQAPVHEDRRAQRDKIQNAGAEPTVAVEAVAAPGFVEPAVAVKAKPTPTFPSGSTCTCYHNGPPWPQGHFYNPSPEVKCKTGYECMTACPYGAICDPPYIPTTTQAPMRQKRNVTVVV